MRIISGIHKGRRILAPKKLPVRPTTDRSKEALLIFYNIKSISLNSRFWIYFRVQGVLVMNLPLEVFPCLRL